jgi:hypothetical protein
MERRAPRGSRRAGGLGGCGECVGHRVRDGSSFDRAVGGSSPAQRSFFRVSFFGLAAGSDLSPVEVVEIRCAHPARPQMAGREMVAPAPQLR